MFITVRVMGGIQIISLLKKKKLIIGISTIYAFISINYTCTLSVHY